MATFFSTDQRGLTGGAGGDMSFHHHYPMASYQDASGGGLIPLPASIAHIAQDEAAAFMGARADNGQPADSSGAGDLQTQLLMGGDPAAQRRLHQHHQGGGGGLSLSLGTQVPGVSLYHHQQQQQYRPGAMASPMSQPAMAMAMAARQQQHQGSVYVHNSRFLKAARELLDEVVSVRDAIVERKKKKKTSKEEEECDRDAASKAKEQDKESHEENSSAAPELSPADRQEVQNKVTALMGMLDQEVQAVPAGDAGGGGVAGRGGGAGRGEAVHGAGAADHLAPLPVAAGRHRGPGAGGATEPRGGRCCVLWRAVEAALHRPAPPAAAGIAAVRRHDAAAAAAARVAATARAPGVRRVRAPRLALRALPPPVPQGLGEGHAGEAGRLVQGPGVQLVHQREGPAVEADGGGDVQGGVRGRDGLHKLLLGQQQQQAAGRGKGPRRRRPIRGPRRVPEPYKRRRPGPGPDADRQPLQVGARGRRHGRHVRAPARAGRRPAGRARAPRRRRRRQVHGVRRRHGRRRRRKRVADAGPAALQQQQEHQQQQQQKQQQWRRARAAGLAVRQPRGLRLPQRRPAALRLLVRGVAAAARFRHVIAAQRRRRIHHGTRFYVHIHIQVIQYNWADWFGISGVGCMIQGVYENGGCSFCCKDDTVVDWYFWLSLHRFLPAPIG